MADNQLLFQVVTAGVFFVLAITFDLVREKIPNWLCLIAIFCGFLINSYFAQLNGLMLSFIGFSLAFIILFPTFMFKILGAGDIKLMMGIGALIGPQLLVWSIAYAIIAGAITSLLLVIWKSGLSGCFKTVRRYWDCFYLRTYFKPEEGEAAGQRVPYAPALAIGWLWACSLNPDITYLYSTISYSLFS
ncbi:prepilin peptidase [Shewanella pealeana]|uniref:Peptidase A24A prepilin type IV n=1 Tax=Shewanella pealeana (strain ATCC 700345 / ANG-SQ1) TaxID=398579 RepID=A8H443_SHEPA|nr:A24 family peptidase [Shewanella pealeana]ABV87330.1 peptidase A24A prepilin type IV [Shewanella pealeana ATCC 700345]